MAFSGALTLTDLNDFIGPSQACIKPVEQVKAPEKVPYAGSASTQIHVDAAGSYYEVSNDILTSGNNGKKLETAEISLNDCLACSGCITSAESVLITMQSHEEVLNVLSKNPPPSSPDHRIPVLSIAPQSLASLAASISTTCSNPVTLRQVFDRVKTFCQQELGFSFVYDTTFARHIALLEHASEFRERKDSRSADGSNDKLPMLASACPGWVCYAEKTHAEMLPFISRTKSPQQIMGILVKNWIGGKWHKTPNQIYHVTVMPCYDKKLEASRQDFYNDIYSTRDVDCVLTTGELELLMRERGWDLSAGMHDERIRGSASSKEATSREDIPILLSHPGSSSGSYLQSLITEATSKDTELSTRTIRSSDYEEYTLTDTRTGEIAFKGAKCFGFRNLQNLVRKVGKEAGIQVGKGAAGRLAAMRFKRATAGKTAETQAKTAYDYVEVMACPSGCVNGGGQLRPRIANSPSPVEAVQTEVDTQGVKWGDKEWTKKVEQAYWHDLLTPPPSPGPPRSRSDGRRDSLVDADDLAIHVLLDLCRPKTSIDKWNCRMDAAAEASRRRLFRTEYRAVQSEVIGIQVKW